jgi:hypothetical protein
VLAAKLFSAGLGVKVRYALGSRKQWTSGPKPKARVSFVRWKLEAKSRANEQKPYRRQNRVDELALQSEVQYYPNLVCKCGGYTG